MTFFIQAFLGIDNPHRPATYTGTVQAGGTLKLKISNTLVNSSLTDQGNAHLIGATLDSSSLRKTGSDHDCFIRSSIVWFFK
ncbi:hypothetical protein [Pseudomonas syringae group sp. J309-1]|uniref:hypothetical protein n=1 Tax=Pseudomonas syringae group sp. J309-1 TaxID=3079588 RepID=UPI002910FD8A|nr:hypothetical protein [Pseudomonas syringae group sp. J309-1]MDU8359240.1 hypothetical protein [Pseudomonas syringae group sp. J309-1]